MCAEICQGVWSTRPRRLSCPIRTSPPLVVPDLNELRQAAQTVFEVPVTVDAQCFQQGVFNEVGDLACQLFGI